MATLTDCKTGKTFPDLMSWISWKESTRAACPHTTPPAHLTSTTRRGTYHALECPDCGERVKYWMEGHKNHA